MCVCASVNLNGSGFVSVCMLEFIYRNLGQNLSMELFNRKKKLQKDVDEWKMNLNEK